MTLFRRFNTFTQKHLTAAFGALIFSIAFASYIATLAPAQVPGDPSEYTFIPWILGIAHPPGYGFYTLLAALWQRLIPIGSVAYRTNLLSATAGALSAMLVFAIVQHLIIGCHSERSEESQRNKTETLPMSAAMRRWAARRCSAQGDIRASGPVSKTEAHLPAIFAGLSFAAATDVWQHSIHTNAHIITLLLATFSVFLLIEWWRTENDRWLYCFALVAGLSPAQHPLLVLAFPAYAIFIVIVRPRLFLQPKKLLGLIGCFGLGLGVFLYYPLRSPTTPFGVSDIRSWDTFIHFVSAEGLRVNLFQFGLADQPTRFSVFIELLKLQFPSISILFAILGVIWLARRAIEPFVLCFGFLALLYAFIINTEQDVMAYLLLPFMMTSIFIGLGVWVVALAFVRSARLRRLFPIPIAFALLLLPINTLIDVSPRVSLQRYTFASDWVNTVLDRFAGKGEHATLLAAWEAMTPLWVAQYAEGRTLNATDVISVYVTTAKPWLQNVFEHLDAGPVYLADYRREVVEGKLFRLRPEGSWPLWRVVPPGDTSVPPLDHRLSVNSGVSAGAVGADANVSKENEIEILSYSIDQTTIEAGQPAHLTLAMRAAITPTHIIMPYALVGGRRYAWTTDSRLLTPDWLPNEVIVERYDITLPFNAPSGEYPLKLGLTDLNENRDLGISIDLGSLHVVDPARPHIESAQDELADFNAQITLLNASANGQNVGAIHESPLQVKPGESIKVWLTWLAEQQVTESYKVFVHLIDGNGQLIAQRDNEPLDRSFPTQLWIPKWIEGQLVNDPYQIVVPPNLPPGDYWIETGLYGQISGRRVTIIGRDGNLAGDRVILFKVRVQS